MPVEAKVSLPTRYEEPRQDRLKRRACQPTDVMRFQCYHGTNITPIRLLWSKMAKKNFRLVRLHRYAVICKPSFSSTRNNFVSLKIVEYEKYIQNPILLEA